MAEIKTIRANNADIYPVTHEDVVVDNNGFSFGFRYQPKTDNFLSTTAKTITGGINEINSKLVINEAQNNTASDSVEIRYIRNAGARVYPVCHANAIKYTNGETLTKTFNSILNSATNVTNRISTAESSITTMNSTNTTSNGKITTASTAIGTLSSLQTSAKSNLVAAVNEINQFGSNFKTRLTNALSSKGVISSGTTYTIDDLVEIVESNDITYEYIVPSTYTVENVSGASYGFEFDSNTGYWISKNQGVNNSAALCKVTIDNPSMKTARIYFINHGEPGYDFGLIGRMGVALSTSNSIDTDVYYSCENNDGASEQYITLGTGKSAWFHIKYRKDESMSDGYDAFQFRLEFF